MTIGVLQPGYLPWTGFFAHVASCDLFLIYDCVQYDRESWRNRNRVRTRDGWVWLTVPIRSSGRFGQRIADVEVDNSRPWARQHRRTLRQYYAAARFYALHAPFLDDLFSRTWDRIVDVDLCGVRYFLDTLGIPTPVRLSSTLGLTGSRNERLLNACLSVQATRYVSTDAGAAYLDVGLFQQHGIQVEFQRYQHPFYRQAFPGFISHLSILDLILNHGPESREILERKPYGLAGAAFLPRPDRRLAGGEGVSPD